MDQKKYLTGSTLHLFAITIFFIKREYYPLEELDAIYCKTFLIEDHSVNPYLPQFDISAVIMPAVINPLDYVLAGRKIKRILEIMIDNDCKDIVLGAWGCGVFNNDPVVIAQNFQLYLNIFDGYFDNVIFAIPNKESKNHIIFKTLLG